MLKQRIIAKLLIEDGVLVKYKNFTHSRRLAGDPVATARIMEDQCVDEFFICDLGVINPTLVRAMTADLFTPVTAAGSIKMMEQVDELIRDCGVDKVVIKDEDLADDVASRYGKQAVVWPLDYVGDSECWGMPDCAGEAILTSIDRDGMGAGFDLLAVRSQFYNIPMVVAGGCGKLSHVKDVFESGASGACIGSMFFFSDKSPVKLRSWLVSSGANVRAV